MSIAQPGGAPHHLDTGRGRVARPGRRMVATCREPPAMTGMMAATGTSKGLGSKRWESLRQAMIDSGESIAHKNPGPNASAARRQAGERPKDPTKDTAGMVRTACGGDAGRRRLDGTKKAPR